MLLVSFGYWMLANVDVGYWTRLPDIWYVRYWTLHRYRLRKKKYTISVDCVTSIFQHGFPIVFLAEITPFCLGFPHRSTSFCLWSVGFQVKNAQKSFPSSKDLGKLEYFTNLN